MNVFLADGTGYIGSRFIPGLQARSHFVRAPVQPGSEGKLPPKVERVFGDALQVDSYTKEM